MAELYGSAQKQEIKQQQLVVTKKELKQENILRQHMFFQETDSPFEYVTSKQETAFLDNTYHQKIRYRIKKEGAETPYSEVQRSAFKVNLIDNTVMDLKRQDLSEPLREAIMKVRQYALIDTNAIRHRRSARREARTLAKARSLLEKHLSRIQSGALKVSRQEESITSLYLNYLNLQFSGLLNKEKPHEDWSSTPHTSPYGSETTTYRHEDGSLAMVDMDCTKTKFKLKGLEVSREDEPLFAHEPSIHDISQGGLGDCYLLAALGSLVNLTPQAIKECMHDNGKTVTVRFFVPSESETQTAPVPYYVTVSKKVPPLNLYAKDTLWVQMIERAYAASGLHLTDGKRPVYQEELTEKEKAAKKKAGVDPEEEERPAYKDIEAGWSGAFIATLTARQDDRRAISRPNQVEVNHDAVQMSNAYAEYLKTDLLAEEWNAYTEASKEAVEYYNQTEPVLNTQLQKRREDLNTYKSVIAVCKDSLLEKDPNWTIEGEATYQRLTADVEEAEAALKELSKKITELTKETDRLKLEFEVKKNCRMLGLPVPEQLDAKSIEEQKQLRNTMSMAINAVRAGMNTLLTRDKRVGTIKLLKYHKLKKKSRDKVSRHREYYESVLSINEISSFMSQLKVDQLPQQSSNPAEEAAWRELLKDSKLDQDFWTKALDAISKSAALHYDPFTGDYTEDAKKYYDDAEKALKEGTLLSAGTTTFVPTDIYKQHKGLNNEHTKEGLAEGHAYTLMGVFSQEDPVLKKDIRYVKLRNPWGSTGREYLMNHVKGVMEFKSTDDTGGIFYLELNDFMRNFATLYHTTKR